MNIDIANLRIDDFISINETYSFSEEQLRDTEISKLDDVKITGEISKNSLDETIINIIIEGEMILPCAVTLKPVNYHFMCEVEGDLEENLKEFDENYKNNQKSIDILPIIWENILMEIPIRVVSDDISDVVAKGNGWELITEEKEMVNPSLAKLKDLL